MAGDDGGGHGATSGVWITVVVIIIGSILAGVALVIWNWPMFWVGVGLMVAGSIAAYFVDIMDMVTEFGAAGGPEIESS